LGFSVIAIGKGRGRAEPLEARLQFSQDLRFIFVGKARFEKDRRAACDFRGQFIHALAGDKPDGFFGVWANQGESPIIVPLE
jgi:hypothetical protein